MSTEQLAIVVPAVVTVVVSLSLAYMNIRWQRDITQETLNHQERINRDNHAHESKLAVQARVAGAYEEMMEMVHWQMDMVDATKPILASGDSKPPDEPGSERIRKVQARVNVHGSQDVKAVLQRWADRRNEFFADAWLLDHMQNSQGVNIEADYGITLSDQWRKVEGGRRELHDLVRDLADAASAELRA